MRIGRAIRWTGLALVAWIALPADGSAAAGPLKYRPVAPPVRLPAVVRPAGKAPVASPHTVPASGPARFQPIAAEDFKSFEPAPAFELDLGLPSGSKMSVGGWVEVGYRSGGLGQ